MNLEIEDVLDKIKHISCDSIFETNLISKKALDQFEAF